MGWLSKIKSVGSSILGGAADGIDAVADAGEDVVEAVGKAGDDAVEYVKEDLVGDALLAGGTVISEALYMVEGVVDIPGNVVESVAGSNVVTDAFYVPGDMIEAVNDLVPGFLDGDEDSADAPEPTQLTAPTRIPEGVMTAAATVVGAVELPTEQEGDEEEMLQPLIAEDTGIGAGALAGAVTATEAIITTPTESGHGMHEDTQPATDTSLSAAAVAGTGVVGPAIESEGEEEEELEQVQIEVEPEGTTAGVVDKVQDQPTEVVEDPVERVGGFADKISVGADSALDVVEDVVVPLVEPNAERVDEVLERTGEAALEEPVADVSDIGLVGIGDFGSGAVDSESALEEARTDATADDVAVEELADQDVSTLFTDPVAATDEAADEPSDAGFLEGVTESVSDFVDDAAEAVGDAVDAVSDFVEDLFDGE